MAKKKLMKDLPAGSYKRKKEYDRRNWAYDDTIDPKAKRKPFIALKKKVS